MLKTITCIKRNSYVSQNSRGSEWEKDIQFCWGINIQTLGGAVCERTQGVKRAFGSKGL